MHPTPKNIAKLSQHGLDMKFEGASLALHYLELVLRHLFGFMGKCRQLVSNAKWSWDLTPVPWSDTNS